MEKKEKKPRVKKSIQEDLSAPSEAEVTKLENDVLLAENTKLKGEVISLTFQLKTLQVKLGKVLQEKEQSRLRKQ